MIPFFIMMWALAVAPGYLAGDVFITKNRKSEEWDILPWISAVLPPLAAVLAVMAIFQAQMKGSRR